jgi:hypothetical protein
VILSAILQLAGSKVVKPGTHTVSSGITASGKRFRGSITIVGKGRSISGHSLLLLMESVSLKKTKQDYSYSYWSWFPNVEPGDACWNYAEYVCVKF